VSAEKRFGLSSLRSPPPNLVQSHLSCDLNRSLIVFRLVNEVGGGDDIIKGLVILRDGNVLHDAADPDEPHGLVERDRVIGSLEDDVVVVIPSGRGEALR